MLGSESAASPVHFRCEDVERIASTNSTSASRCSTMLLAGLGVELSAMMSCTIAESHGPEVGSLADSTISAGMLCKSGGSRPLPMSKKPATMMVAAPEPPMRRGARLALGGPSHTGTGSVFAASRSTWAVPWGTNATSPGDRTCAR